MSDKKEEFEPTDQTMTMSEKKKKKKKKKRKKWRIKQNGRWFKIGKKCLMESEMLRPFHGTPYFERYSLHIKRTSILIKALEFCKKRGQIRTIYAHKDPNLLQHKLKEFDSNFLNQIKNNDDDAIDLIDAAGKLMIKNLFNLLFEDVVGMIARKTPEDIEKIFKIRYKKDDDEQFEVIKYVMGGYCWPLEKQ